MKILITSGIYPPKIGGPAQYTKNLKEAFESLGHSVLVKTFGIENYLPSGLRHFFFFLKIVPSTLSAEIILALDTFSVGLPTVLVAKIFGKKVIIRVGGDFLWEQYVERTKKKVLLKNFYDTEVKYLSTKEKIIFKLTKWTLENASRTIFSTEWQREIFLKAYNLKVEKTAIIENYYGPKESDEDPGSKLFLSSSRKIFLKNEYILNKISLDNKSVSFFSENISYPDFMKKMKTCYAVVSVSLSEVSPNIILDAIRLNRPFICTRETGIYERIKDVGIFVDPLNQKEIEDAVLRLLDPIEYQKAKEKVRSFNFVHTWQQIAGEFIEISK